MKGKYKYFLMTQTNVTEQRLLADCRLQEKNLKHILLAFKHIQ